MLAAHPSHSLGLTITIDTITPTLSTAPIVVGSGSGGFSFTQTPTIGVFVDGDEPDVTLSTYEGTTLLGTGSVTDIFDLGSSTLVSYGPVVTLNPRDGVAAAGSP